MAVSGLGYDLRNCEAWLFDLSGPPAKIDAALAAGAVVLCDQHASEITVPLGWELTDQRATELDLGLSRSQAASPPSEAAPAEPPPRPADSFDGGSTPLLERAFRVGRTPVGR